METPSMETSNPAGMAHARSLRAARRLGYAGIALFAGTIGVWSVTASISGAVIAPAQFVSETNLKKVQHQTGGIVAELKVREGDRVQVGQLLVRLDETVLRANLAIITKQLDQFVVRSARLEAERDGRAELALPAEITARIDDPDIAALVGAERRLFQARAAAREGVRAQLGKRILQLRSEIEGLDEQRAGKKRERAMIERELVGVRDLFNRNLVQINRLSQLEREAASLDGNHGQLTAQIAQAEGKIAEIELQILQLTDDLRAEVLKELREVQNRAAELQERRVAAEDQLNRVEIRAPVSGYVHQLAVHTVGGVISPAEPAMLIVPSEDLLYLEARIAPTEFDQVRLGQPASVRIHASNQRNTPDLVGHVSRLSADVSREQQTGQSFYVIRIAVTAEELARLEPLKIVAGMQAEAFIQTSARTPLQYFLRPLEDQFARAFRER